MSKIGDLFVKLGLKKDEFSNGLKEAGVESEGFVGKLKGIGTKAAAIWAAVGVGAVAMADKFAHTSERFGDLWDQTMAGMKAAWDQFTTSLTNFDFNGFGQRVKDAFDAARNSAAAHDAEFEVMNSINLRKAEMREDLAQLQLQMRNQNLSNKERLKAQQDYLDKVRPLYEEEASLRRDIWVADANEYLAQAGLAQTAANRDAVKSLLVDIAPNSSLIEALDAYNQRNSGNSGAEFTAEQEKIVDNFMAQHDIRTGATLAVLATHYLSTNSGKDAGKVVDALEAYYSAAGAFDDETRKVQQLGDAIVSSSGSGKGAGSKEKTPEEKLRELQQAARDAAAEAAEIAAADAEVNAMADQMVEDIERTWDLPNVVSQYEREMADGLIAATTGVLERQAAINEEAKRLADEFTDAVVNGYVDGIQTLTDQLFGLEDINPGAILQGLLSPLADMAINEGKILMASGIGIEAIKKALQSLNGFAAVAAGAALVALGSAVKSGLGAIAQAGASSGYASTYSGSSSGSGSQTIATEMTIYVEGRISGRDIVLSGQKTVNSWNR